MFIVLVPDFSIWSNIIHLCRGASLPNSVSAKNSQISAIQSEGVLMVSLKVLVVDIVLVYVVVVVCLVSCGSGCGGGRGGDKGSG